MSKQFKIYRLGRPIEYVSINEKDVEKRLKEWKEEIDVMKVVEIERHDD